MQPTLRQPPMVIRPGRDGRFKLGHACIAFLLVLLVAGLNLMARTPIPAAPRVITPVDGASGVFDYPPKDQRASPSESLQEILAHPDIIPTHHHPLLGRQAPGFELVDSEGKVWSLSALLDGRPLVLIFSYGFHCIHCARQLTDVNRDLPLFRQVGARVAAISGDSPELTRRHFQQYGSFGFPVLADPGNKVAQTYRVFRSGPDGTRGDFFRHGTFIIRGDGTVHWANVGDAPFRRNSALISLVAKMEGRLPLALADPWGIRKE